MKSNILCTGGAQGSPSPDLTAQQELAAGPERALVLQADPSLCILSRTILFHDHGHSPLVSLSPLAVTSPLEAQPAPPTAPQELL